MNRLDIEEGKSRMRTKYQRGDGKRRPAHVASVNRERYRVVSVKKTRGAVVSASGTRAAVAA